MPELDMERIVDILHNRGVHAYVEQTGGGCATIYAGPRREVEGESRYAASAGPGWFAGPGWMNGRAHTDEFYVGRDDDGESEYTSAQDDWDEAKAAEAIVAVIENRFSPDSVQEISHDSVDL